MSVELTRQLRLDEGTEATVYQDNLGYWTIGVGRLVDRRKPGAGLRPREIDYLLANDIAERTEELTRRLPWFADLDPVRQGVLLNMAFQMGVDGLLAFKQTLAHVQARQWPEAAHQMLKSLWARQTPARAQRLAEQMRTGVWQYAKG